ncbi:hypothetical protein ACOZCG_31855 [Streptomyces pseudogriseolus]|uniref:hypothetical protein n=1 Tax=Streptomyces pseudogriseolus TaxID=36817 RepID=UPI003FA2A26E
MHAPALLRQPSRTLVITAAAVPLALAVLADDVRVRRQLQAAAATRHRTRIRPRMATAR